MKRMMILLLAAPILACGPGGVDPDPGNPGSFTATLSMSLPSGSPAGILMVDNDIVCSDCLEYDAPVNAAGTYEASSDVINSLCIPQDVEIDENGETVPLTIPCGLAPNGQYTGDEDTAVETDIFNSKIRISFIEFGIAGFVNGDRFEGLSIDNGGIGDCDNNGSISNDLQTIDYVFNCPANTFEGTLTLVE